MNWINIQDKKPEHGSYVLIAVRATKPNIPYEPFTAVVSNINGQISFRDKWAFCETFKMTIDFWMPLPELPPIPKDIQGD